MTCGLPATSWRSLARANGRWQPQPGHLQAGNAPKSHFCIAVSWHCKPTTFNPILLPQRHSTAALRGKLRLSSASQLRLHYPTGIGGPLSRVDEGLHGPISTFRKLNSSCRPLRRSRLHHTSPLFPISLRKLNLRRLSRPGKSKRRTRPDSFRGTPVPPLSIDLRFALWTPVVSCYFCSEPCTTNRTWRKREKNSPACAVSC